MAQRHIDLRKVFQPSDTVAFVVIVIGLFIALFIDEMAVRLIGVCITILGGVGLFMMVSPRLSDQSMNRPPRPSESPSFMSETRQDALKKSQIFDSIAYRATFGGEDIADGLVIDDDQIELFPELMTREERDRVETKPALDLEEVGDGQSSVRILGTKRPTRRSSTEPELAIKNREARRAAVSQSPAISEESPRLPQGDAIIAGPVTEEIQLSDDVVVRPRSTPSTVEEEKPAKTSEASEPQADPAPPKAPFKSTITLVEESTVSEEAQSDDEVVSAPVDMPRAKPKMPTVSASTYMLEPEDELESSEEPRKEFDFLLNRVLMVIRSVIPARTAAFFWFNKEKQQLVLEAKITDAPEDMTEKRKLPIGHDVVSQIALEGRPEILTQISPAAVLDLLPYYKYKSGTKSFVGVPVYFKGNVVGVLCADAAEEDAYTDVTIGFFGHFTKLISGLVTSYTTKFDLHQSARKLDALTMFKEQSLDANTEADVIEALFDTVIHFVEVSTIGVCTYDKDRKMWTIGDARSVVEGYGDLVGSAVDLDSTLIGDCVHSGEIVAESSPERTRVTDEEYSLEGGQFVGIPLRSEERTYGALFIENLQASISNQDFALTELLGDMAGDMIERLRQRDQLASGAIVESDTDLLNREGVHRRLKEEFARSTDYQSPFSVCLIQVDPIQAASDNGTQAHELVIRHLTTRVREQLRDYDIVGRMDGDTLVIGLPAYHSQEAQYWVEGLRRDIASSPLDIGGKRTSATISVGIAEANPEDTWDSLLTHASAALNISAKQQNKVTVFS